MGLPDGMPEPGPLTVPRSPAGSSVGASQPGHPGRQHHQQAEDPDDGGAVEGPAGGGHAGSPDPEAYDSGAPPWRLK